MKKVHVIFIAAVVLFCLSCEKNQETYDELEAIWAESNKVFHIRVIDLDGSIVDEAFTPIGSSSYVMSTGYNEKSFSYCVYSANITCDLQTIFLKDIVKLERLPDLKRGNNYDILVITVDS